MCHPEKYLHLRILGASSQSSRPGSPTADNRRPRSELRRADVKVPHFVAERLTSRLWSGIEETYAAILAHPFVRGLQDGSLERESFEFYVVQDAHYLRDYARALSVASARKSVV